MSGLVDSSFHFSRCSSAYFFVSAPRKFEIWVVCGVLLVHSLDVAHSLSALFFLFWCSLLSWYEVELFHLLCIILILGWVSDILLLSKLLHSAVHQLSLHVLIYSRLGMHILRSGIFLRIWGVWKSFHVAHPPSY